MWNKILLIIITLALGCTSVSAKGGKIIIKGKVTDKSRKPIQYAAIVNTNTSEGVNTNATGDYIFKTTLPLYMEVTALGYKIWQTQINESHEDTVYINITLEADSFQLTSVTIVNQYKPVVVDEAERLRDFDFKNDRLWLLYGFGKNSRLYITDSTDTKQAHVDLNFRTDSLALTVHGLLYTGYNDSVYFYYWDSAKFKQEKTSLTYFNSQTYNLIEYNFPYYYKYFKSADNVSVTYWYFNKMNGDSTMLYTYKSKEIALHDSIIYSEILTIIGTALGVTGSPYSVNYKARVASRLRYSDGVPLTQGQSNQIFIYKFMLRSVFTVLHFVNDSLYVFNFDNDSVYVFDNKNQFRRQMPLIFDVHGIKYNKKDIIVDEEKKHCYFKYQLHSIDYLEEIDLNGIQKFGAQAIKFPYVKKIRISRGIAYFANYDYSTNYAGYSGQLCVYKQKLDTR